MASNIHSLLEKIFVDLEEARGRVENIFPLHTLPPSHTLREHRRVRECLSGDSRFSALSLAHAKAQEIEKTSQTICRQIKSQLDQIHNALVPVYILPNEVMRDIFRIACVDSTDDDPVPWSGSESESADSLTELYNSALSVSHVSRRWRDIALGQRALWSHIELQWPLEKQRLWLERASRYPLQVVARYLWQRPGEMCPDVLSASHPWRSLTIDGHYGRPHGVQTLLNALHTHDSLETLVVSNLLSQVIEAPIPCLKHLLILNSSIPSFTFMPSTIVTLELETRPDSDFHLFTNLLASCPQLQHLAITQFVDMARRRVYQELSKPRLSLPRLESLQLATDDCQDDLFGFTFEFIEAPRLQKLAVAYCPSCDHEPSMALCSHVNCFLDRSPALNELVLLNNVKFIRQFLSRLKEITCAMIVTADRSCMPDLQELKIQPDPDVVDAYDEFGDALESFLDARARVLSFNASSGSLDAVHLKALKKLIIPHCPVNRFHLVRRQVEELRWVRGEEKNLEDLYDEHRELIFDLESHDSDSDSDLDVGA